MPLALFCSECGGLRAQVPGQKNRRVRPYGHGDMRIFEWAAVFGIVTAIGVLLVLGSGVAWIIRRRRRV